MDENIKNMIEKDTSPRQLSKSAASNSHWTLMVVFFSLLIDLLGFTVILPLIPSMLEHYSKTDQVVDVCPCLLYCGGGGNVRVL